MDSQGKETESFFANRRMLEGIGGCSIQVQHNSDRFAHTPVCLLQCFQCYSGGLQEIHHPQDEKTRMMEIFWSDFNGVDWTRASWDLNNSRLGRTCPEKLYFRPRYLNMSTEESCGIAFPAT
ncbi:hypothetical protein Trydic_g18808 [Trypoxylus dichotomus]